MEYIKIPIGDYARVQIDSIKKTANKKLGVNLTDEDIMDCAIDILYSMKFIHFDMISKDRLNKHLTPILEIIGDEQLFLQFLCNAPKNHEKVNRVLYNNVEKLNKLGVSI